MKFPRHWWLLILLLAASALRLAWIPVQWDENEHLAAIWDIAQGNAPYSLFEHHWPGLYLTGPWLIPFPSIGTAVAAARIWCFLSLAVTSFLLHLHWKKAPLGALIIADALLFWALRDFRPEIVAAPLLAGGWVLAERKPAAAGFLLGLAGIFSPRVFFVALLSGWKQRDPLYWTAFAVAPVLTASYLLSIADPAWLRFSLMEFNAGLQPILVWGPQFLRATVQSLAHPMRADFTPLLVLLLSAWAVRNAIRSPRAMGSAALLAAAAWWLLLDTQRASSSLGILALCTAFAGISLPRWNSVVAGVFIALFAWGGIRDAAASIRLVEPQPETAVLKKIPEILTGNVRWERPLAASITALEEIRAACEGPSTPLGTVFSPPPDHPILCPNASRILWFTASDTVLSLRGLGREDLLDRGVQDIIESKPALISQRFEEFFRYSPEHAARIRAFIASERYASQQIGGRWFYRRHSPLTAHRL